MSTLAERLKQARRHAGLTQKDLAAAARVSQPVISQIEKGENLQSVHLVAFAHACGVNAIWLAEGKGEMAVQAGGTDTTAASFPVGAGKSSTANLVLDMLKGKNLRPDQLSRIEQAVSDTIEDKPAAQTDNVITADFSRRPIVGDEIRIAHYDVQGAMGGGKVVHDYPEMFRDVTVSQQHLRELGVTYKDPAHLKLITGAGQSMEPTIKDKDPLIADASIREFVGDGIYALSWHGHFYIKRLQVADAEHFEMISDNPKHKDRIVRIDETYIQAKILLVWNATRV